MTLTSLFIQSREAARHVASLTDDERNLVLLDAADAIEEHTEKLLQANRNDLARMDNTSPLYDRLMLTPERLKGIAQDIRHVVTLPSPLDITLEERTLPNGLQLRRMSVPFGVVGVVY
ncbi:MAG: gamma-glutamyl-phosphate reductase, partial [Bacteroidaceae bacterium]